VTIDILASAKKPSGEPSLVSMSLPGICQTYCQVINIESRLVLIAFVLRDNPLEGDSRLQQKSSLESSVW
jgi:hypothetical protein